MAKKFFTKALSVGLSLTLCASLAAPAFALDITQAFIDEASSGNASSYIDLKATEEDKEFNLVEDIKTDKTLRFTGADNDAVLNMDGHTIDHQGKEGSVIAVTDGAKLVINADSEDGQKGVITGGTGEIIVSTWNNDKYVDGGGVYVGKGSSFTMTGGQISGNHVHDEENLNASGGGIYSENNSKVELTEVTIDHNSADSYGSAICSAGTTKVTDCIISDNTGRYGALMTNTGRSIEVTGTQILNNTNTYSTFYGVGDITLTDCTVSGNTAYRFQDVFAAGSFKAIHSEIYGNNYEYSSDKGLDDYTKEHICENHTAGDWETVKDAEVGVDGLKVKHCVNCGRVMESEVIPALSAPTPTPVTRIGDQAIPLADGPVTRAQFIDYLWRHEGEPEAEIVLFADHEYAPAIAWALSAELIDEEFQPDELVTVADVRAILGSFETVFGAQAVAAADLTTLTGADDEAVLNCGEVLAEFFGEEYAPAQAEEELAA